jgi:hypothetical protein
MPYKNTERQRDYQREYKRHQRAGTCQTPCTTQLPAGFRLKTARDVLALIEEQVQAVRGDEKLATTERARTIGYLAGLALRAVEVTDLSERMEAVERVLSPRKDGACNGTEPHWPNNTRN